VTPNISKVPLRVATKGTVFPVLGVEGDWFQVEWIDSSFGRRVGFIQRSDAVVAKSDDSQTKPVDLSIRKPGSTQSEPVDISIKRKK
jgi:hypothetical protein